MCEQPVITHADTETAGHPVKNNRGDYSRPAPKEQRRERRNVRERQKDSVGPINTTPVFCREYFVTFFQFDSTPL